MGMEQINMMQVKGLLPTIKTILGLIVVCVSIWYATCAVSFFINKILEFIDCGRLQRKNAESMKEGGKKV